MSGGDGSPCKTLLFGAIRDPLKSIGHCKLKVAERNENHVIVGIIVEDDWVEIKEGFLKTLNPPEPVEKVLKKQESISELSLNLLIKTLSLSLLFLS